MPTFEIYQIKHRKFEVQARDSNEAGMLDLAQHIPEWEEEWETDDIQELGDPCATEPGQ
jgi:hypothetical protein